MSGFDQRRTGFETKAAWNAELRFKALARRDKMLGLWAAAQFGLSDAEAEDYARAVARADLQEPGDDDVVRKLLQDFAARNLPITETWIRQELARLLPIAEQLVTQQA